MKRETKAALIGCFLIFQAILVIILIMAWLEPDPLPLGWEDGFNHEYNEPQDMAFPVFLYPEHKPLKDFETLDALKKWLAMDDVSEVFRIKLGIPFNEQCVVRAEQLRDSAEKDGYNIEIQALSPREHLRIFGTGSQTYHAVGMARVDNYFYVIEPATDLIKRAYKIP